MDGEVLIHIAAPSTSKDDEVFRSLAEAYLSFQPYDQIGSAHAPDEDSVSMLSATEIGSYGTFPTDELPTSLGQALERPISVHSIKYMDDSLVGPNQFVQLERIQDNWRNRNTPRSSRRETAKRIEEPPAPSNSSVVVYIDDTQLATQAIQSQLFEDFSMASADFPNSPDFCDLPSGLEADRVVKDEEKDLVSASEDVHNLPSQVPVNAPHTVYSPAIAGRIQEAKVQQVTSFNSTTSSPRATLLETAKTQYFHSRPLDVPKEELNFNDLPIEVTPPAPQISIACMNELPSQTTNYLEAIKRQHPSRFKYLRRSRALAADERGCWLINSTRWPRKVQYEFWMSMCEHIQENRFGWGVFLYREPPTGSVRARISSGLGQVRLYCWGEIVEQVWLAAWLCSAGRLSGSGSRWLDAEDAVILQVL